MHVYFSSISRYETYFLKEAFNYQQFFITIFHTQEPGDSSICLQGQKVLATIFVMKT